MLHTMYSKVVLCLLSMLMNSLDANIVNVMVNSEAPSTISSCQQGTEENLVICVDLDTAIEYVVSVPQSVQNSSSGVAAGTAIISLPNGVHYITTQTNFGDANVHFVGLDHGVMVVCDYQADNETSDAAQIHTWYFNKSENVVLENVHFRNCGFPFRFIFVQQVNIRNCTFMNFSEAVLDIYNCRNVVIDEVALHNNSGVGRLRESVRGNSGGVAIGYNMLPAEYANTTLTVSDSIFMGNRAMGVLSSENAVTAQVYVGRGGGMALYMNESQQDIHAEITNCVFESNTAELFGGGLFILTTSYESSQHVVNVQRTRFLGNVGMTGGAGIQLSFLNSGDVSRPHSFTLSDCTFERNRGKSGGGMNTFIGDNGNKVRLDRCEFIDNRGLGTQDDLGAAVAFSYLVRFIQRVTSTHHEVNNCTFVGNSGPNGVLSVGYAPMTFTGLNRFISNKGASLVIVGSLVDFEGEIEFRNNSAMTGGVLSLLSFGQMRLRRGTYFTFEGNFGRLGSSIVVETSASLLSFGDLLFNPRCFILYEDSRVPPQNWDDVGISFTNNEAIVSAGVYLLQRGNVCSWSKQTPPFFNSTFIPEWPLWSYQDNKNTGHLDSDNQLLSFGTSAQQFALHPTNVSAWPGQKVTMELVGLDSFNHFTSTNTRFTFEPNRMSNQSISAEINSQIIVLADSEYQLLEKTFPFSYSVSSVDHEEVDEIQPLGHVITEEAFNPNPVILNSFSLYSLPCPGGYAMTSPSDSEAATCTCVTTVEEILFCEDDQDSIILEHGLWASYTPNNPSSANLHFHGCPAGYCSCNFNSSFVRTTSTNKMCIHQYKQSDPDSQCVCDREGILCGRCKNGTGVSILLNKCVSCSDGYLSLIPLLVVVIIVVLVTMILIDKPLPDWMIPFLFYIQNAPYATLYYPETFESVGNYLYYLNSATSLYFAYDFCLSSNLSVTHSFLLRYIPALTALIVFFLVWLIRKRMLKRKTLLNYGCWWFLLLLYSSVAYTSMSALHCPSIPDNNLSKFRWFMNGDVQCFTGAHAVLALLAIGMLAMCFFFVVFTSILPSLKSSLFKNYKKPFTHSFKDQFSYWSGIELGRRFLFLLALVPFPRNTVYAIFVLVVSLCLYAYCMPYKSKLANILELAMQLNFLVLLVLELTPFVREELFVFSGSTDGGYCDNTFSNLSYIVILLAPIYYVPLLVISVVAVVFLIVQIKRYTKKARHYTVTDPTVLGLGQVRSTSYTTQSVGIDHSQESPYALSEIDHKK